MNYFYVDSSALVKRYHEEKGTNAVDYVFDMLVKEAPKRLLTSTWAIPETMATLNRKKNEGKIEKAEFNELLAVFFTEMDAINIITVDEKLLIDSLDNILKYNLNSADALHLATAKEVNQIIRPIKGRLVLLAADKRLLKAAQGERFQVFNPEEDSELDLKRLF